MRAAWRLTAALALLANLLAQPSGTKDFSPEQLFAAFGQVLAAATLAYKLLSEGENSG